MEQSFSKSSPLPKGYHVLQFIKNLGVRIGWNLALQRPWLFLKNDFNQCNARFRVRLPHSIWIHGEWPKQLIEAERFFASLRNAILQTQYIHTTRHTSTTDWHHFRYPNDVILGVPWNRRATVERFFDHLSPQLIILLQSDAGFPPHAYAVAKERKVPIVMLDVHHLAAKEARRLALLPIDHFTVWDETTADALRQAGCQPERISITGSLGYERALQARPPEHDYVRTELGLTPNRRLVADENLHITEEDTLLDTLGWLKERHPQITFVVRPQTPRQIQGLAQKAKGRGLTVAFYQQRRHQPAGDLLIIEHGSVITAPLQDACDVVIAGGTFSPLPGIPRE